MTSVLVTGALANKPGNGGEAWVRLSWVLGLQRLGCRVWFVEQICREACTPPALAWFNGVTKRFGLSGRAALVDPAGTVIAGPPADEVEAAARSADLLLNISGNLTAPLLDLPRRRAYVDLDPGYTQVWHRGGGLGTILSRHEHLLTVALSIGAPGCTVPTDGEAWRSTPPPVVLAEWPATPAPTDTRLTTVASWRGGYGRLEHDGRMYGQKAHEFRRLLPLPSHMAGPTLELALAIDPWDARDLARLRAEGWRCVDPSEVAGDPDAFRRYIQGSTAELSAAQGVYAEMACGWFSDRTTRYLASGRPAIVQDTGLPSEVPRGTGLLTFRTAREAARAIDEVLGDYDTHARAARRLAEELFDSDIVIARVLEELVP